MATSNATKKTSKSRTHEPALMELFTDAIKDIYWAEKQLVKTLPEMEKAATSPELAGALAEHMEVTGIHVNRLEHVFQILGKEPQAKKCDAMAGLLKEGESIIEETADGSATRDVGIILAAQKVEHYEIATYGALAQLAETLGLDAIAQILAQTLIEEKETDEKLSAIAEHNINYEAAHEA